MKKLLLVIGCLLLVSACSKPVERTQDPVEIEKKRLEHKATAQREMQDG